MGTVYRVLNTAERRQSALKVLSSEAVQLNPSAVERFLSEGRLAAGLRHQNIVRVYGVGQLRGAYYIEMRLVAGPSVRQALRAVGRLSIAETVAVGRGVLKALVYAHSGGLVHRDIKPDNIMLSRRGSVRVTDFGIAKDLFAASAATQSGEVVGTPWYMAPEQVRGGPVDGRCDLYALGVTMFEMLAGEPGSLGVGPAVAMPMASSDVIPALQQARPDLPPRLARFIRKLMARDRRRRPSDAAAALARLERVAALERVEPADLLALVRRVLGHGPSAPDGDTTGPARSVAPPTPEPPWVRSVWIGLLAAALLAAIVAAYRVMQPPARDPLSHEATGYELLK
jgi:serine/threonine-protein kinase